MDEYTSYESYCPSESVTPLLVVISSPVSVSGPHRSRRDELEVLVEVSEGVKYRKQ